MLRDQIVSEIMKLVKPPMVPMDHKPSIDEIEKMLNSDNPRRISIAPDGIALTEPPPHTVGDIADAIIRVIGDVHTKTIREAQRIVQAECPACDGSGHSSALRMIRSNANTAAYQCLRFRNYCRGVSDGHRGKQRRHYG